MTQHSQSQDKEQQREIVLLCCISQKLTLQPDILFQRPESGLQALLKIAKKITAQCVFVTVLYKFK